MLNGKRLLLRGTHRHEDHAGVAAAMTEDMIITEMKMMKEMGVNFIRLGHYQQSRIVLIYVIVWAYWYGKRSLGAVVVLVGPSISNRPSACSPT